MIKYAVSWFVMQIRWTRQASESDLMFYVNSSKNNSKYCSFSEEDPKLKEDENISYEMTVHKKRYEAVFYQLPDTTAANYNEEIQSLVYSKYTKEQLENPSEEISQDIYKMAAMYALDKAAKKSCLVYDFRELWSILHNDVL